MPNLAEASRFMREMPQTFKTRADGENFYIEGFFAVFNKPYERWEDEIETIAPGAFIEAIANDDVRALINHDTTLVLGRNKAGTLVLEERPEGLWGSILINPKDQDAMNAYARVERGDVSQCSFGFDILDYETVFEEEVYKYTIKKVKLYEVSICTFPAYTDTEVKTRNALTLEQRKAERAQHFEAKKLELIKKLKGEKDG